MHRVIVSLVIMFVLVLANQLVSPGAFAQNDSAEFVVSLQEVDDLKSVFARVESKDRVDARVRTGGTVAELNVDEGAVVESGEVLALVVDPKITLQIQAVDAKIAALESRLSTAESDYQRARQLRESGVIAEARLDQFKTAFDGAKNDLLAAKAERAVIERRAEEGAVLAPTSGRVLRVPVTEGSVMLVGETIATIAASDYILRLEVPERHARFMEVGDPIRVGERGLEGARNIIGTGRIVQVFPELLGGRVVADAEAPGLGDYFVGERAQIWISAGKRDAYVIPPEFLFTRHGLNYVRLAQDGGPPVEIVVQPGRSIPGDDEHGGIEILSGLQAGDRLIRP